MLINRQKWYNKLPTSTHSKLFNLVGRKRVKSPMDIILLPLPPFLICTYTRLRSPALLSAHVQPLSPFTAGQILLWPFCPDMEQREGSSWVRCQGPTHRHCWGRGVIILSPSPPLGLGGWPLIQHPKYLCYMWINFKRIFLSLKSPTHKILLYCCLLMYKWQMTHTIIIITTSLPLLFPLYCTSPTPGLYTHSKGERGRHFLLLALLCVIEWAAAMHNSLGFEG